MKSLPGEKYHHNLTCLSILLFLSLHWTLVILTAEFTVLFCSIAAIFDHCLKKKTNFQFLSFPWKLANSTHVHIYASSWSRVLGWSSRKVVMEHFCIHSPQPYRSASLRQVLAPLLLSSPEKAPGVRRLCPSRPVVAPAFARRYTWSLPPTPIFRWILSLSAVFQYFTNSEMFRAAHWSSLTHMSDPGPERWLT